MIKPAQKEQLKDAQIIFDQALEGMGFVPNSLKMMAHKPNILGGFVTLFANIKGFSHNQVSTLTALRVFLKTVRWTMKAKKSTHQEVPLYLKDLIAHVSSNASGCRYCQAHTALEAHIHGAEIEKIEALWDCQTSPLFSDKEKAALSFALAAGAVPNFVTAEHHAELEKYYTPAQIVEIVSTISVFGFLNRWNDSMMTPLEEKPLDFASQHLKKGGWEAGKHLRHR
ncbi:MAG: carboxymuconolactone decarboxylase family protein [Bacteroidota bacterium]